MVTTPTRLGKPLGHALMRPGPSPRGHAATPDCTVLRSDSTRSLGAAVASIMLVALRRAAEVGELDAMRAALADVLEAVDGESALPPAALAAGLEPMDAQGTDLPAIGDASEGEAQRLAALMRRQLP